MTYYKSLTVAEREQYAARAKTTLMYLVSHIFRMKGSTRTPKPELLINLAIASEGQVSLDEAIDYFHVQPIKALAKEMQGDLLPEIKPLESRAPAKQIEMKILNKPERVNL